MKQRRLSKLFVVVVILTLIIPLPVMSMGILPARVEPAQVQEPIAASEDSWKLSDTNGPRQELEKAVVEGEFAEPLLGDPFPGKSIAAGYKHTCALTVAGGVKCWGENAYGKLGNGTQVNSARPVEVTGLSAGVIVVAAGRDHTCALMTGGGVKCWGRNNFGQLGDGTMGNRMVPVDVSGLSSGVTAISLGNDHTCALTVGGGVKCWGRNNYGQLGDGTDMLRLTPIGVQGLGSGVEGISVGFVHSCALTTGGGVKCWGHNQYGQVGDGSTTHRYAPVAVSGLSSGASSIGVGQWHSCVVMSNGSAKCWGFGEAGQLGNGDRASQRTPVDVIGLGGAVNVIAPGEPLTCVLTTAGGVKCWGDNGYGGLGDGTTVHLSPRSVSGLESGATAVTADWYHMCARTVNDGVKCWGWNIAGQLGDGTTTDRLTPVDVVGFEGSNLPDFQMSNLNWSPETPRAMEQVTIDADLDNLGSDYYPTTGEAEVRVTCSTASSESWLWVLPQKLGPLPRGQWLNWQASNFLILSDRINRLKICFTSADPESDTTNNCTERSIAVMPADAGWRSCVGAALGVLFAMIPAEGVDKLGHLFAEHTANIAVQCQVEDGECMAAGVSFLLDTAFLLAELAVENTVLKVLEVLKSAIQQFFDSYACGEYLSLLVRTYVESARHRDIAVNAAMITTSSGISGQAVSALPHLEVTDALGRTSGYASNGSLVNQIPGALPFMKNGLDMVLYPGTDTARIEISSTGSGTSGLLLALSRPENGVDTVRFDSISLTGSTHGQINVQGGHYTLTLDDNGDQIPDRTIEPSEVRSVVITKVHLPLITR